MTLVRQTSKHLVKELNRYSLFLTKEYRRMRARSVSRQTSVKRDENENFGLSLCLQLVMRSKTTQSSTYSDAKSYTVISLCVAGLSSWKERMMKEIYNGNVEECRGTRLPQ